MVKKMGRPPLEPEKKCSESLTIHLTPKEMDFLTDVAAINNESKNNMVRKMIFGTEEGE